MKFFALGVGVLCALLLSIPAFRKLQHVPAPTQTGASELFAATPKLLPQPASGLPAALPPGTVVSVTLTQPIDSARDAYGKAYEASVDTIEGQPIAPASKATVVLVNNNTGWLTQLTQLTIKGRKFQVSSGAGSVVGAEQASEPTPLLRLALGQSALSNARDSSQRVLLPPATQLRFALIETGTAGRTAAGNSHHATPAGGLRAGLASGGVFVVSDPEPNTSYLCHASDVPDRELPLAYYIADVFETSDSRTLVEKRWHDFLVAFYPYRFANNPHATAQCNRLNDPASDLNATLDQKLKTENAQVIQTKWHYTLGPPPAPAPWPAPSARP